MLVISSARQLAMSSPPNLRARRDELAMHLSAGGTRWQGRKPECPAGTVGANGTDSAEISMHDRKRQRHRCLASLPCILDTMIDDSESHIC